MSKHFSLALYFISITSLFVSAHAGNKVLIITHAHSRPDFIELHAKTFKAFLKDDYEYVVFNDAPNDDMRKRIEEACARLGITCIRIPQELHAHEGGPGYRHIHGIQFSLEQRGFDHDGIVLMIDSDMFLTRPFSVIEYMQGYDFIAGGQYHTNGSKEIIHASACLTFMNMPNLPNKRTLSFRGDYVEGVNCDVGGQTYYYFKNNPTVRTRFFRPVSTDLVPRNEDQLRALGYNDNDIDLILILGKSLGMEFHGDGNFLHHYAGGSNWPGYPQDYMKEKCRIINHYIDSVLLSHENNIRSAK